MRDSREKGAGILAALLFLESAGYVLKKLSAKGQERATEEECLLLNIFRFD